MAIIELIVEGPLYTIYTLERGDRYDFHTVVVNVPIEGRKLIKRIDYFSEKGDPRDPKKCASLGDGLFEFKTIAGKGGVLRTIFFYFGERIVICTQTFYKNIRKMPPGELPRAKLRRQDFLQALANKTLKTLHTDQPRPRRMPK